MHINASITGFVKYTPLLCSEIPTFSIEDLGYALAKRGVFILNVENQTQFALSRWVSPKRTRSYPFAHIYDSLRFKGKRVTIIPVWKDEGKDGENDYIQWDYISLMSLLDIYVIIGYYARAQRNPRFKNKITKQEFDILYIKNQIDELMSCHSSALHWNMDQLAMVGKIADKALLSYRRISSELGIELHSHEYTEKRVALLHGELAEFMEASRKASQNAQEREMVTVQPKESISGNKSTITIKNYLGGFYYLTADEAEIVGNDLYLYECKHSKRGILPSWSDIKEGLLKMLLFCNLENVLIDNKQYQPVPVLKLTAREIFQIDKLSRKQRDRFDLLREEANSNKFKIDVSSVG